MTAKRFVDRRFWFGVISKLECIRSYWFPVMNKKLRCQDIILTSTGVFSVCHGIDCRSVLILWHFDCSLDFFNFSLRGTKIHHKNLHFWDQLKASFSSNICPDCIACHLDPPPTKRVDPCPPHAYGSRGHACGMSQACPVSTYLQKFSIYLKTLFENNIKYQIKFDIYFILFYFFIYHLFIFRLSKIIDTINK